MSNKKTARFQIAEVQPDDDDVESQHTNGDTHDKSFHATYSTNYIKSLRHYLTRDALPAETHYRNIFSINSSGRKFSRPTIEELHEEQLAETTQLMVEKEAAAAKAKAKESEDKEKPRSGKVIKFGWIEGVFMRCLLNIWGVMLFLRLSWVVGQAGLMQGFLVLCLCNVVTIITALSMSAVSTNGQIKGGGIYYLISRSLGPEFGGAIGIMFTLANSIAVSMYIIGFCDSLVDMLKEIMGSLYTGIIDGGINDVRLIGGITLILILLLAIVGMDWVTRVQMGLLFLLIGSQIDFFIGSFLPAEGEAKFGFTGYSAETAYQNLWPNYHDYQKPAPEDQPSFFSVFGVFFPAVTGIVAGANLSGDLKDPAHAIPKGTLLAIMVTFITYVGYGIMIGCCYLPYASGNATEYEAFINGTADLTILPFNNCSRELRGDHPCEYGSAVDQQTMAKISITGYLIYAGCFAATLSSAIASLVGAPRVLQALAKDKLYPLMGMFSKGHGANNDPLRGYLLVFALSLGCILIGDLDMVSTLLSNFFVAAYALINFSVFHASITKSPGWRPSFRYFNQWIALLGTFLCVAVMFLMDWTTALITFGSICFLYMYISYRKPEANWGSSTQAQQFVTTLKNIQDLNDVPEHVKNYRPKLLVFSGNPAHRQPLVDFANLITKKLSLLVCVDVVQDTKMKSIQRNKLNAQAWFKDNSIRAFYTGTKNPSFEHGAVAAMDLAGLGRLCPNMVLLGFKSNFLEDSEGCQEYINAVHYAFEKHYAVGILRLPNGCDFSKIIEDVEASAQPEDKSTDEEKSKPETAAKENADDLSESKTDSSKADTSSKGSTEFEIKSDESSPKSREQSQEPSVAFKARLEVVKRMGRSRKISTAVHGSDGKPLSEKVVFDITQFQTKKRKGTIDVWWLYDDGGLTLLLPYILTTRSQFADCQLRIFSLASKSDELDRETRNMAALLSKFRIDFHNVTVIPDITKKANADIKDEFKEVIDKIEPALTEDDLMTHKEKTNRHLRLAEMLREHSKSSEMVIMTLPMPRRGVTIPQLYMSWMEIMTRNMPPFLLVRGNQTSVLTFYS